MCTTLLVGRRRSATGRVLVAHSEELGRNSAHRVSIVPGRRPAAGERYPLHSGGDLEQPDRLAGYICTRIFDKRHYPGDHTSGVNEHGVAVANNMAMMRGIPESAMFDPVPGGVIWTEFLQLALERASTAREALDVVARLCERHGLSCDSGTMIAVADPEEAFWVELARDGHWAAERVRDDEVAVRANCYRVSPFDEIYGDPANQRDRYNLDRHDALAARLSPLSTVGVADLFALLRDVYEGTSLHCARPDGSPFRTKRRTIARMNTEASTVIEPRRGMPAPMAHRMWCCLSTSLSGTFVPFHEGVTAIESHYATAGARYDTASAYWLFTELAKLVDSHYRACAPIVRDAWRSFEGDTLAMTDALESGAAGRPDDEIADLVTRHDEERAAAAIRTLRELLAEVKTRAFYEDF
jgi:dipeptidase